VPFPSAPAAHCRGACPLTVPRRERRGGGATAARRRAGGGGACGRAARGAPRGGCWPRAACVCMLWCVPRAREVKIAAAGSTSRPPPPAREAKSSGRGYTPWPSFTLVSYTFSRPKSSTPQPSTPQPSTLNPAATSPVAAPNLHHALWGAQGPWGPTALSHAPCPVLSLWARARNREVACRVLQPSRHPHVHLNPPVLHCMATTFSVTPAQLKKKWCSVRACSTGATAAPWARCLSQISSSSGAAAGSSPTLPTGRADAHAGH
jgi:hypothetical protein